MPITFWQQIAKAFRVVSQAQPAMNKANKAHFQNKYGFFFFYQLNLFFKDFYKLTFTLSNNFLSFLKAEKYTVLVYKTYLEQL